MLSPGIMEGLWWKSKRGVLERRSPEGDRRRAGRFARTPPVTAIRLAWRVFPVALLLTGCTPIGYFFPAPSHLDPVSAGPDFLAQGEYVGGRPLWGAQVVALGEGEFDLVLHPGGLPGAGWDGRARTVVAGRRTDEATVRFGETLTLTPESGVLTGTLPGGRAVRMARVERRSPTLGAEPPPGAVVLVGADPPGMDGVIDEGGFLEAGATSFETFGDFRLHLEFRTPFTPGGRGQFRGNSGVYLQDRYEVQVLDSFGRAEADDECGGIYGTAAPRVNMTLPPLVWQTYDIEFRAARFDVRGEKIAPARASVVHNGVVIHSGVEIAGPTGGGERESPAPGPLHLQDHRNPVVFRNVWVLAR